MIRKIILTQSTDGSIIAFIDQGRGETGTHIVNTLQELTELLKTFGWK